MSLSLKLYYHPLASFCWKTLIALYENGTEFEPHLVDLGNPEAAAAFKSLWPIRKFPVLQDHARGALIPESTTIIEYLDQHYPGAAPLVPGDPDAARDVRFADRLYDLYVHLPMQKIMTDRLRPEGRSDPHGVEEAKATLLTALGILDKDMAGRTWATGEIFSMADCAACPALYYGNIAVPFMSTHRNVTAYLARLQQRPSFARVLKEAEPYFKFVPREK
jgi:glutathione S-transferase